jgi:hypothetical protein
VGFLPENWPNNFDLLLSGEDVRKIRPAATPAKLQAVILDDPRLAKYQCTKCHGALGFSTVVHNVWHRRLLRVLSRGEAAAGRMSEIRPSCGNGIMSPWLVERPH